MNDKDKDKEAQEIIDTCAKQLFALTGDKPIPSHWKIKAKKALNRKPGKVGRKLDRDKGEKIVAAIIRDREKTQNARKYTKNQESEESMAKEIARETGSNSKTVKQYLKKTRKLLFSASPADEDQEVREIIMAGAGKAVFDEVMEDLSKETK